MEVGSRVFCKSDELNLDNVKGTVQRTKLLGCEESCTVMLEDGTQVAFFGPKVRCVAQQPLSNDPTKSSPAPVAAVPITKKRISRKKLAS